MELRKNLTGRIATGAIMGFVLGLIISTAKPLKPDTNQCMSGGLTFTPNGGCDSYFQVPTDGVLQLKSIQVRRDFSLCVTKNGKNNLADLGQPCGGNLPTLMFSTYTGKETRLCLGTKGNNTYGTLADDASCSNFKEKFIGDDTSAWFTWEAYLHSDPTSIANPSSGR